MSNRREVQTFEFRPPDNDRVAGFLRLVTEAGQGWINLMPGVASDEAQSTTVSAGVFALFGKFRIAVNFTDLKMMGSHSFMNIRCAPDAIEDALKKVVGEI